MIIVMIIPIKGWVKLTACQCLILKWTSIHISYLVTIPITITILDIDSIAITSCSSCCIRKLDCLMMLLLLIVMMMMVIIWVINCYCLALVFLTSNISNGMWIILKRIECILVRFISWFMFISSLCECVLNMWASHASNYYLLHLLLIELLLLMIL